MLLGLLAAVIFAIDITLITPLSSANAQASALYRAINLGGTALVIDSEPWEAHASAPNFTATVDGGSACSPNPTLIPATDTNRFNMIRCSVYGGQMNLRMRAVPIGSYDVYLYLWEDNQSATTTLSLQGRVV